MPLEKAFSFVSNNWAMIAATVIFLVGLWYSNKLAEYRLNLLEVRLERLEFNTNANREITNGTLIDIKLQLMEVKTLLGQRLPRNP